MKKNIILVFNLLRVMHWIKNFALFAPLIFSGTLFIRDYFWRTLEAFFAFNLISSAAYIFNDLKDAPYDRLHPIKKKRPIASKKISKYQALFLFSFLVFISLSISIGLGKLFFLSVVTYILIQMAYSLELKKVPIVDILIIAFGFVLRVYAGAFVIDAHLSVWFLLTVISTALFLAAGKRRSELAIYPNLQTRTSLSFYTKELLNSYVTMFGNASWMSWALYSFFESPRADLGLWLMLAEISKATTINKLLMLTIPIVIFIVMRYQKLIFDKKTEAPEKVLLTDKQLVGSLIIYCLFILFIFYGGITSF